MKFKCCVCGKIFNRYPSRIKDLNKPHCSTKCANRDNEKIESHRHCNNRLSPATIRLNNAMAIKRMFK